MKKLLCICLSVVLLCLSVLPVLAADETAYSGALSRSPLPIITISGDGDPLYNAQGERVLHYKTMLSDAEDDENSSENIKESVINVLKPFLLEGVLTNRWDNYYAALQKEISELLEESLLDNDGNATNGTDIAASRYETNRKNMKTDRKWKGTYGYSDYYFYYDWRLDPLASAERLHEYITAVRAVTKAEKVCIISRCLGTSVVAAYVAKYGMEGINGIAFHGGVVNGSELLSETISGKFTLNPSAIQRFLADCRALGLFDVDSFITASIDLLDKNGVFDTAIGVTKATVYNKLVEGVTSALALSTFFTWPCYWAAVTVDDFDAAMQYVFGDEGSEKRSTYAGLIEKLENYNTVVRQNLPEIFHTVADNGNICILSKYGFQLGPICESGDAIADQFATVYRSSMGATCSTVYDTLSDAYVLRRTREGRAKYISPDKQIDATTCLFPDNTWFVKGSSHSNFTSPERNLTMAVVSADHQLTPETGPFARYIVWDNETNTMSPMTAENCNTYNWTADIEEDAPDTLFKRILVFFKSLINWFKEAYRFFGELQAKEEATTVA